jgi:hypothetical protein
MARRLTFDDPADAVFTPTRTTSPSPTVYRPSSLLSNGAGLGTAKFLLGIFALVTVLYVVGKAFFGWLAARKRKRALELTVDWPPEWLGPGCQTDGFFVGNAVTVTAVCDGHTNEEAIVLSRFESKRNNVRSEDGYVELERTGVVRDRMTWTTRPLRELGKYRVQYVSQKPKTKTVKVVSTVTFSVTAPRIELAQTVALWKDAIGVRVTTSPAHPGSDSLVLLPHSGPENSTDELQQRYVGLDVSSLGVVAVSTVKVPTCVGPEPLDVSIPGSARQG